MEKVTFNYVNVVFSSFRNRKLLLTFPPVADTFSAEHDRAVSALGGFAITFVNIGRYSPAAHLTPPKLQIAKQKTQKPQSL